MTIPEPTYDPRVQSYTATVCGKPVYGRTRAACNDRIYEVLSNRRRFLQHDLTAAALLESDPSAPLADAPTAPDLCRCCGNETRETCVIGTRSCPVCGEQLSRRASLPPLAGDGGAADAVAAPPEPLGAPAKALRDLTPEEIMDMTSGEFALAHLADNCAECANAPRVTCPRRSRCDAETYGVG